MNVKIFFDVYLFGLWSFKLVTWSFSLQLSLSLGVNRPQGSKCQLNLRVKISIPLFSVCIPGFFKSDDSCVMCRQGTYKADVGDELCTSCDIGGITPGEGATSEDQCSCKYHSMFFSQWDSVYELEFLICQSQNLKMVSGICTRYQIFKSVHLARKTLHLVIWIFCKFTQNIKLPSAKKQHQAK